MEQARPANGHSWPWVTFAANVAGAALLAALFAASQRRPASPPLLGPLLGVGLCGALTTFSTLQLETVVLVHGGHAVMGVAYGLVSMLLAAMTAGALVRGRPSA